MSTLEKTPLTHFLDERFFLVKDVKGSPGTGKNWHILESMEGICSDQLLQDRVEVRSVCGLSHAYALHPVVRQRPLFKDGTAMQRYPACPDCMA